jgi:hypothetical protein
MKIKLPFKKGNDWPSEKVVVTKLDKADNKLPGL